MIEVEALTKDYGAIRALDGVSFEVRKGEIVGFLGPNGAGKTTCMKIITGFLSATSGTVRIAGQDVVEHGVEVRRRIGYLPENAPLYPDMTTQEYLSFVGALRGIGPDGLRERVRHVADTVGVADRLGQEIGTLSKGYRQRVGLAQAMIHDPEILILDEPTSGLDPNQIVEIRALIREIGRDRTVILSTHNLPEVTATCNRLIIIHRGRIAADGTPDQIQAVHGGGNAYVVEVLPAPDIRVEEVFRALQYVETVAALDRPGQDALAFRVEARGEADVRADLFRACARGGLTLVGLRRDRADLETIFQRITLQ